MMKKTLFLLSALLLAGIGASAQVDYTSYLENGQWSSASTCPSLSSAHESYNSSGNNSTGKILYCTVSGLPAGTYTVSFYVAANAANVSGVTSGSGIAQAYVSAEGTVSTEDISVGTLTSLSNSWSNGTLCTFTNVTVSSGSIEFGLQNVTEGGNWYVCEGKSLVCTSETLTEGDVAHYCVAWDDEWSITGNSGGSFQRNVWSGEGSTDGTNMLTPFIEYWVGSGSVLSAATISHETLTGLQAGTYEVSIFARAYNEGSSTAVSSGITFTANDASIDLTEGGTATDDTTPAMRYGTYTLEATVYDDGNLDIGFGVNVTACDWIAWKNLSVKYTGPITDPTIGSATADKTVVKPGEKVTITFETIVPDGYTLVGSEFTDETVGTVSYDGNGVFSFTVPDDASGTFTITIPEGQLYYTYDGYLVSNEGGSNAETTLTFTVAALTQTEGVYLKNLYGGDLLSRGKDYGTRADVDFVGLPVNLILQDDGRYVIQYADVDPSEAKDNYLYGDSWAWADGDFTNDERIPTSFTVEMYTDDDGNTGYHFTSDYGYLYRYDAADANSDDTNDDYALAVNGTKGTNYTYDTQAMWTIVSIEERDAIKAQWVADQKVAVAKAAGLTTITSGDEFDAHVATLTETQVVNDAMEDNTDARWNAGTFSTNGVETYETVLRLNRTITGLDEGIYRVTLNGMERHADNVYSYQMYQDGYTDISNSYLVAGNYEINLKAWGTAASGSGSVNSDYSPNDMAATNTLFQSGNYLNELYTYVGEDGELDINISMLTYDSWGWAQVKNLNVYYLGEPIEWTLGAEYGTLILPFDYDLSSTGLTAYTGTINSDGDEMELTKVDDNAIKAYNPYIIGGAEEAQTTYYFSGTSETKEGTTFADASGLTGVLEDTYAPKDSYVLQKQDAEPAFYLVENDSEILVAAYHCYLDGDAVTSGVKSITFTFGDDVATRIDAVETEETANDAIYDLSGRRVAKAQKGIYIVNGKKMVIK